MKLLPMIGLFALLVSPGRAQEIYMGLFPHYAVGGGWSSTIHFVPPPAFIPLDYRFEFMDQNGAVIHNSTLTAISESAVLELNVPEFAGTAIASGVVHVYCTRPATHAAFFALCAPRVGDGHLLFRLRTGNVLSQSAVPFQFPPSHTGGFQTRSIYADTRNFVYGVAVYNDDVRPGFIALRGVRRHGGPRITGLTAQFVLGPKEHRTFLLSDLYGDIPPGLYMFNIELSPWANGFLVMQFCKDGSFSQTPVLGGLR